VMVLALSMVISVICAPSVFALNEKEVTLFETDFENEAVGAGAKVLNGINTISSETAGNVVQGTSEGNSTKYFDTKGGANQRFRMWFNQPVSSGTIVAEFDLNAGVGKAALGLVYDDSVETYKKWPFFLSQGSSSYEIRGYLKAEGNPPTDLSATEGAQASFTKSADGTSLTFKPNTWQHYKVKINLDEGKLTAYVDGVESATVSGYEYFKTSPIGGLAFYMNKAATLDDSTMFDNIKIYKEYGTYLIEKDFEDGKVGTTKASATVTVNDNSLVYEDKDFKYTNGSKKYLSFGTSGDMVRYMFNSISKGKMYVEFDVRTGFGGIGMGVFTKDDTNFGDYHKAVFSSGTKNSTPARGLKAYTTIGAKIHPSGNAGSETYIKGYRASGATVDMALAENKWQHAKLEIDMDNARTRLTIDDTQSEYITGFTYLSDIIGIGFKWSPFGISTTATDAQKEAFIDNIKVYTVSDGVSSSLASGGNKIKLTFKDTVDSTSVNNIALYKADGTKVDTALPSVSDDKKTVTITSDSLTDGTKYFVLLNGVKYEDGYAVCETRKEFTHQTGAFTVAIDNFTPSAYTQGTKIDVNYNFTVTDFSEKNVDLIIAAYNGGELTEVQITPATVNKTENKAASLTLTKDCDEITAFVWENTKLIPLAKNVTKTK
ncbi:MAG: Ig-like domain-containing protein, partial [Oscillospiraceae bacterium]|nr:Ig-like domain-containing protein [Oscillospiraceae bacterium]